MSSAEKQGTMPGARRRGRPHTAWMDNIKTWTGISVEESVRTTEDRDKWRKYVHGVARCTQARKTTHSLDGHHQDVDRTLRGRVSQNDRGQGQMEKVRPWCGQALDRGRLRNRTEHRNELTRNTSTTVLPRCIQWNARLYLTRYVFCWELSNYLRTAGHEFAVNW